jgi:hypothetical protein
LRSKAVPPLYRKNMGLRGLFERYVCLGGFVFNENL